MKLKVFGSNLKLKRLVNDQHSKIAKATFILTKVLSTSRQLLLMSNNLILNVFEQSDVVFSIIRFRVR